MANIRHVWTANYLDLMIFPENSAGQVLDGEGEIVLEEDFDPLALDFDIPSILTYCFLQNATLNVNLSSSDRRPVTGRSHRKIVIGQYDDCTLECEHFFFRKQDEINVADIFNRKKRLRLVCKLFDPSYDDVTDPFENDLCQLTRAVGSSFGITGPENDVMRGQASFMAEEFL